MIHMVGTRSHRRLLALGAFIGATFLVAAIAPERAGSDADALGNSSEVVELGALHFADPPFVCTLCEYPADECIGGSDAHIWDTWVEGNHSGGSIMSHDCSIMSCTQDFHMPCGPEEEEQDALAALYTSVESLGGTELRGLIERFPNRLLLNAERGALQVLACGETMMANLTLRSDQLEELVD